MAFVPDKEQPKFTDLKGTLAQSKNIDNALYQTIQILLEWLDQLQLTHDEVVQDINNSVNTIISNVTIIPSNNTSTFLTTADETIPLANSVQLIAGNNIVFDDSIPHKRYISSTGTGTGTPTPHHITHQPGGSDPMDVDSTPLVGSLRTLGTGPNQAAPGNDPRFNTTVAHAPTHSAGGFDPVDVRNLAGYPGGTTQYLRADHTFAVPPGGTSGGMNLDYLGDYVSGPVYNDGDIVIGSDGVLYMCTVDGTITPPEPWPGAGIAVNATVDATYWTVSPHSQLTNERAMNGLGTGYVRSTVGEPSVVPTIPLTDTTGILPDNRLTSNVALKNIDNFFVAQTFATSSWIKGSNSALYFNDTAAAANLKIWRFINYSDGNLHLESLTDNLATAVGRISFGRAGALSAASFWGDGYNISNIYAPNIGSGFVNPARLGSGVANYTVFLRGDQTWAYAGIPSGMIVLYDAPCPAGYTRVTAWDGRYIMSGTGGVGGNGSHSHTLGNLQIPAHDHGGQISGTVDADGNHSHAFSGSGSGSTGGALGGTSGADAGGSFTAPYAAHTHDFSVTVGGQTGDGGFHAHNFRTGIPSQGAIGVVGGMDAAANDPYFVALFLCRKD